MAELKFFQPYQSTYVDMKLPEIAEIQRNRYDASKAEYDKLTRALGGIRVAPGDEPLKTAMIQSFDDQLAGNVQWETLMPTVQNLTTQFATNTKLMDAMDTQATHQKEQEFMNKVVMEGGENSLKNFNNQYVKDATGAIVLNPDGTPQMENRYENWNTERDGIYTMGAEAAQDYTKEGLFLLQGINENASILRAAKGIGISQAELNAFFQYGTGISGKRIQDLGKLLTDEFADNNAAGAQMLRDYMQLRINPTTGNTYTDSEARGEITKFLTDLAMKQQGSKLSYLGNNLYVAAQKAAMDQPTPYDPLVSTSFVADSEKQEALDFEQRYRDITRNVGREVGWFPRSLFNTKGDWTFNKNEQAKSQQAAIANNSSKTGMESKRVDELLKANGGNWAQISAEDLENNMVAVASWVMDPANGWNTPTNRKYFLMPDGTPMNDRNFVNNMGKILGSGENLRRVDFNAGQAETITKKLRPKITGNTVVYTENHKNGITLQDLSKEYSNLGGYSKVGFMRDAQAAVDNAANPTKANKQGVSADGIVPIADISLNTAGEMAGKFHVSFTSSDPGSYEGQTMSFSMQPYENFSDGKGFQIAQNVAEMWQSKDLSRTTEMRVADLGIMDPSLIGKSGNLIFFNDLVPNGGQVPGTAQTYTDLQPAMLLQIDSGEEIKYRGWNWVMQLENEGLNAIAAQNNFVGTGLQAAYRVRTTTKN